MRQAKNVKIGDVIQFPRTQYDKFSKGWNGWLFSAGIVERLYTSKKGIPCATVRYCTRRAGRYQLLPNVETTINLRRDVLFVYDLDFHAKGIREFLEAEKSGEQICWSEDAALLVNHGLI